MAYRKSYRKSHRRSHKKKRYSNNFMNSTVSVARSTNKKYMPKVKHGLENVGSKVIKTGTESVPFLQRMTRRAFGMFTRKKTKKHYKH
jgi:hypothetical protein